VVYLGANIEEITQELGGGDGRTEELVEPEAVDQMNCVERRKQEEKDAEMKDMGKNKR